MSKLTAAASAASVDVAAELRRFLELGAAQLEAAMRESNTRVDALATAVSAAASDARELQVAVQGLGAADTPTLSQSRQHLSELTDRLMGHVHTAIIALQFYDKLVQRLTHVREGLAIPSDCAAGSAEPARANWNGLLEQVRERYSTVEERVLFDFMMRGLSAEQMLKALAGMRAAAATGEFEAF